MRFIAGREVVSASTDSTLRLWDARALAPTRTFSGHTNEKNFVGLSVDQDFIACGSETNEARDQRRSLCSHILFCCFRREVKLQCRDLLCRLSRHVFQVV